MSSRVAPTSPPTPEDFAALVASLRAELDAAPTSHARTALLSYPVSRNPEHRPASFAGRPWVLATASMRHAAWLTGYSWWTLRRYTEPGAGEKYPWGHFPAPAVDPGGGSRTGRRWIIGDLALWAAQRDPDRGRARITTEQAAEIMGRLAAGELPSAVGADYGLTYWGVRHLRDGYQPGRERTGRTSWPGEGAAHPGPSPLPLRWAPGRRRAVQPFVTGLVEAHPAITRQGVKDAALGAGLPPMLAGKMLAQARAQATPAILDRIVPRSRTGLANAREIGDAFGVSRERVKAAMVRGEIRAERRGVNILADPSRLRFRQEGKVPRKRAPAPVDKDHALAVLMPGEAQAAGSA